MACLDYQSHQLTAGILSSALSTPLSLPSDLHANVSAPRSTPRLSYHADRKQFLPNPRDPKLFSDAAAKADIYRERMAILKQVSTNWHD